jgi:hypothetical protein
MKWCFKSIGFSIVILCLVSCGVDGSVELGVGPVKVGISIDSSGNVQILGGFEPKFHIGLGPIELSAGIEATYNLTQDLPYYLIIVWKNNDGLVVQEGYEIGREFQIEFAQQDRVTQIQGHNNSIIVVVEHSTTTELSRFRVIASEDKNDTGLTINSGNTVHVEYLDGSWTGESGRAGFSQGCGSNFNDPVASHIWPLPPQTTGDALIGYIGNQPFRIGCSPMDYVAPISGELYLGMNDCQDCYWDNAGELFVRIVLTRN